MRVPRTRGLSILSSYDDRARHTIKMWALNDYRLLGERITSTDLAESLQVSNDLVGEVMLGVIKDSGSSFVIDHEVSGGLFLGLIRGSLERQALASQNAISLLSQQNGRYVPFLSQTALNALKLAGDFDMNLLNILKTLQPSQPTFNSYSTQNNLAINADGISKEEAFNILAKALPHPKTDSASVLALYETHDIGSCDRIAVNREDEIAFQDNLDISKGRRKSQRELRIEKRRGNTEPSISLVAKAEALENDEHNLNDTNTFTKRPRKYPKPLIID
jgi:hypothetical protein